MKYIACGWLKKENWMEWEYDDFIWGVVVNIYFTLMSNDPGFFHI